MFSKEGTLNTVVNAAILVVAACFVFLVVRYEVDQHQHNISNTSSIRIGESLDIRGSANSSSAKKTAIIALQIGCRFCKQSLPFYRRLVAEAGSTTATHLIFAFPQSVDDARLYLTTNGIVASDVRQVSLKSIHVIGTPTIILLNKQNKVQSFWIGALTQDNESMVESALR